MVPMIVRVICEDEITDVPITPDTTSFDVVECCRDSGDDVCTLVQVWRNYERILQDEDKPLEILQQWGSQQDEVKFILRYTVLPKSNYTSEKAISRNGIGMKEQGLLTDSLPDGVELSLWELQEMATRQQQQIESQHQILVAKEQRLRFLKHQEARTHQVAAENERLRRLKERVEAQELKLRKLRALRGQVDQDKVSNGTLTSDLDTIRALFNEKEKELSLAVAKVEELTRQLEELKRNGRTKETQPPASTALELDKLRRELLFRNKLKEQQNIQLNQQRDALTQRKEEINSIDKRINELQDRLQRKRLLNQQLANQLQYSNNNNNIHSQNNNNNNNNNNLNNNIINNKQGIIGGIRPSKSSSGLLSAFQNQRQNIAAVEPFIHVPNVYHQQVGADTLKQNNLEETYKPIGFQKPVTIGFLKNQSEEQSEGVENEEIKKNGVFIENKEDNKIEDLGKFNGTDGNGNENNCLPEFPACKSDAKYQTLPYNTKFSANYKINNYQNGGDASEEHGDGFAKSTGVVNPLGISAAQQHQPQQQSLMTVHSTPIFAPSINSASRIPSHLNPRVYNNQMPNNRGQPVGGTSPTSSTSSLATSTSSNSSSSVLKNNHNSNGSSHLQQKSVGKPVKPVSSVAPTNIVQKSTSRNFLPPTDKPSPIYQTSSTKILPVQPQTLGSTPQSVLRESKRELSSPMLTSTPLTIPESAESKVKKPALPPKPAVPAKPSPPPPPRQVNSPNCMESKGYIEITAESLEQALSFKAQPKTDEVPFDSDFSRSPTPPPPPPPPPLPPPPPPPTSEPPDDFISDSLTDLSAKEEKHEVKMKTNQSSNVLVSCNKSETHMHTSNTNNNKSINNNHIHQVNNNFNNILNNNNNINVHLSLSRTDLAQTLIYGQEETLPTDVLQATLSEGNDKYSAGSIKSGVKNADSERKTVDEMDRAVFRGNENLLTNTEKTEEHEKSRDRKEIESANSNHSDTPNTPGESISQSIVRRVRKGNLKSANNKGNGCRRVSFDPLALLLDASLEGELELVMKTASQVSNPSAANDEGITALHNAICAGHLEIVKFLVEFGCDVNAQDSDGWTPLHCAASCNNLAMVRFLVEHGACIFATTLSDHETAAEKCEEDEEGFDGCSEYLYSIQEKLGILNNGIVYAVYDYAAHNNDELSFSEGDRLIILRKGDEKEREWWWSRLQDKEGYTPRNLLGLYPRIQPNSKTE